MSKNLLAAAVSAAVLFASPFSAAQADEGVVTVFAHWTQCQVCCSI